MSGGANAAVNWSGTTSVTCVTCGDVFDLNAIPKRERESVVLVEPSLPTVQMWQPRLAVLYGKHLVLFKQTVRRKRKCFCVLCARFHQRGRAQSATSVEPRGIVHLHQIRLDACTSPARALDADRAAVAAIRIHGHEREFVHITDTRMLLF
jgi:hypothetical protein